MFVHTEDYMASTAHPLTLAGRVNEQELAKVDAAARLTDQPRAHFVVEASLRAADVVLRLAVQGSHSETGG